jgi:hypothetical protein
MMLGGILELTIEALESLHWLVLDLVGDVPVVALAVRGVSWNRSEMRRGADVEPPRDVEGGGARVPVTADEEDSRTVRQRDLVFDDAAGHVVFGEHVDEVAALYCRRAVIRQREPENGRVRNVVFLLQTRSEVTRTSELLVREVGWEDAMMLHIYASIKNARLGCVDGRPAAEETPADEVVVVHAAGVEVRVAYREHTRNR